MGPRARVSVWTRTSPRTRYCCPRTPGEHAEQNVSRAMSPAAGLRWSLGVSRSGAPKSVPSSRVRHHRGTPPRERCHPPCASWGVGVLVAPIAESRPGFSEQCQHWERHRASRQRTTNRRGNTGGTLDRIQPFRLCDCRGRGNRCTFGRRLRRIRHKPGTGDRPW